jgi:hypothetical protein
MALNNTSINEPAPVIGQGRMGNFGANIFRIRELSVLVVTVVLIVYFSLANSEFLTSDNFGNIADFFSAVALIAVGEVFLLICGEIDLSAGYTFALAPIIMVTLNPVLPASTSTPHSPTSGRPTRCARATRWQRISRPRRLSPTSQRVAASTPRS